MNKKSDLPSPAEPEAQPIEVIRKIRRQKLEKLQQKNIPGYAQTSPPDSLADLTEKYQSATELPDKVFRLAGRIFSRRQMGRATFFHLGNARSKLQVYVRQDILGHQNYSDFNDLIDIGDIVEVVGKLFRTHTGELTLNAEKFRLLTKSLLPLPEKWHGLKDVELRYRQRYLDILSNPQTAKIFYSRSQIVRALRGYLDSLGFLEVETPILQNIAGGAMAEPFVTHHQALDIDLYLRIAPELYLKRLVVGGLEKVYELGKNFRNEGISRQHNPEFTMLEVYQAYATYQEMQSLCEELVSQAASSIGQKLSRPFRQEKYFELLQKYSGQDCQAAVRENKLKELADGLDIEIPPRASPKKILDHIFDKLVQPHLIEPTFVLDYPGQFSPLARPSDKDEFLVERFELFINGLEIANAYSELNNPEIQEKRFKEQEKMREMGDKEIQSYDQDYLTALEYGLAPTGGLGIGVDRLVMILTGVPSIREVIFFPQLR